MYSTGPIAGNAKFRASCAAVMAVVNFLMVDLSPGQTGIARSNVHVCDSGKVPHFTDVAKQSGVQFQHTSNPEKRYIPESMSGGVLLLDYDRDGWLDIYLTNAPTVAMARRGEPAHSALFHNNRDGTFTNVTERAGVGTPCFAMGGAVGDYNNDGWPDMYVTCLHGNVLYRNNGNGTFTDVARAAGVSDGRWSTGAAFADYDGDGLLDLAVANYVDFDLQHLPEPGSASTCKYRGLDVQCGPHGLKGAGDSLFHNNGDGTFTDVSQSSKVGDTAGYYGMAVAWSDFDGSGLPSLFIANDSTPNYLYRNLGHGSFADIALSAGVAFDRDGKEQANMGIATGDYLHTGRPSIFVTTFSDEAKPLYRNDGKWSFAVAGGVPGLSSPASLRMLGWGTGFVDVDNDGWLDLMAVFGHVYPQVDQLPDGSRYRERKLLSLNRHDGTFCDASEQAGEAMQLPTSARGLAFGDLFHNGHMDAVINNLDEPAMVLRNEGVAGMHWIGFELAGTRSNRLAIGAKIEVRSGGMVQTEEIRSGGSYLSQSDLRAHFGLGPATVADSVQIRWPSGHVDLLRNLSADRIYPVLEGTGVVDRVAILPRSPAQVRPR